VDLLAIVVRAAFVFVFFQVIVRWQGKHTIKQGTPFDFVLLLIVGDLVDDVLLGKTGVSMFVTAAGTLFLARMLAAIVEWRLGAHAARS
jgi:uncharacterized membrane protein YcaP (DUF421 family)